MMKLFAGLAFALANTVALAGNNAAPFNLEIGAATLAQAQKEFGGAPSLAAKGQNKFTAGPMYQVAGKKTGIEGIQSVLLIFNTRNVLEGVVITMPKDPKSMFKSLSAKYQLVSEDIDGFMNMGSATFRKGDTIIEIDAPHLSFQMEVRYLSKSLMDTFEKTVATEKEEKEKKKNKAL
jgi:hypothetical protein